MAGFFGRLFGKKDKEKEVVQEKDDGIVIQKAASEEVSEKGVSAGESVEKGEAQFSFSEKLAEGSDGMQGEASMSVPKETGVVSAAKEEAAGTEREEKQLVGDDDKIVLTAGSAEKENDSGTGKVEEETQKEESTEGKETVLEEVREVSEVDVPASQILETEEVSGNAPQMVETEEISGDAPQMAEMEAVSGTVQSAEETVKEFVEAEEVPDTAVETEEAAEPAPKKQGFFKRLVSGLTKTRNQILSGINDVFHGFSSIDDDFYEELEEILVMADIGIHTTTKILDDLRQKVKEQKIKEPEECRQLLIDSIKAQMAVGENAYEFEHQKSVVLLIGVNGVGKTTSVGKLAGQLKAQKKKVLMAAADTFRAAAIEQLTEWANRAGVEIIAQKEGSDPAAVVFDAVTAAKARNTDVLLCDTAGRLHNKKNLMEELKKIDRVITREYPDAYRETLVVLDGTTGQNALVQAKEFSEVADITGIILTKMDGTAKGGIAIAIQAELGIPVKYIGIGEKIDDLQKFHADDFVNALFTEEHE